jgi:hypothetical protein
MPRNDLKVKLNLNREVVEKFREQYPTGSLTWVLNLLLEKFVSVNVSPETYAEIAARELREEI